MTSYIQPHAEPTLAQAVQELLSTNKLEYRLVKPTENPNELTTTCMEVDIDQGHIWQELSVTLGGPRGYARQGIVSQNRPKIRTPSGLIRTLGELQNTYGAISITTAAKRLSPMQTITVSDSRIGTSVDLIVEKDQVAQVSRQLCPREDYDSFQF
jgi:hypothetical protein